MGVATTYLASSAQIADNSVTNAKLAAEACSASKMKKEGTATHVLTSNGAGAVPSYQALPAGTTTGWALIERKVLAANAQNVDFASALDGDVNISYMVLAKVVPGGGGGNCGLRINGSAAGGSQQSFRLENTTFTGYRRADLQFDPAPGTTQEYVFMFPAIKTGYTRGFWWTKNNTDGTGGMSTEQGWGLITTPNTATNITSLGFSSSVAATYGIGSEFTLLAQHT